MFFFSFFFRDEEEIVLWFRLICFVWICKDLKDVNGGVYNERLSNMVSDWMVAAHGIVQSD